MNKKIMIMKKTYLTVLMALLSVCCLSGASPSGRFEVKGRVVNTRNDPVEFSTVVIAADTSGSGQEVAGGITDDMGYFKFNVPTGEYVVVCQCLGYEKSVTDLVVAGDISMDDIVLGEQDNKIGEVVVKASSIRREADRYVVSVAGTTAAIGRDALEMLSIAPGVWVNNDKISVNGREGVRIMVDERLLSMSSDELVAYLRSIEAENIQKIEVIPYSGAEYDADSQGGIIKITLKKKRNDGLEGSVAMRYMYGKNSYDYAPSANLRYRHNKLSLYTDISFRKRKNSGDVVENTQYKNMDTESVITTGMRAKNTPVNGKLGGIYEFDDRRSLGVEVSGGYSDGPSTTSAEANITGGNIFTHDVSRYETTGNRKSFYGTFNYVSKLDTLGSTFKVIGDFSLRKTKSDNDYYTHTTVYDLPGMAYNSERDGFSRLFSRNDYNVYSVNSDLDLHLSPKSVLRTGAKFTYNNMDDKALYDAYDGSDWIVDQETSLKQDYSEYIGALYASFGSKVGKVSYSLGLRGEYTSSRPNVTRYGGERTRIKNNNYFSAFPTINVSVPLNKDGSQSLIFNYGRKIQRPAFWVLNPLKIKISEYAYLFGDPNLKPTYSHDFSITYVLAYKYTLTVGGNIQKDYISQIVYADPDDPDIRYYKHSNIKDLSQYYVALSAPVEFTDWFSLNTNLHLLRNMQRIDGGDEKVYTNMMIVYSTATFTLPGKVYAEMSFHSTSFLRFGNISRQPYSNMNVGLKKRFAKDKFTASLTVNNVLNPTGRERLHTDSKDFSQQLGQKQTWNRLNVVTSLRYSFQTGVKFKARDVERSGDDSRMGGR